MIVKLFITTTIYSATQFTTLVSDLKKSFTRREIAGADKARMLYKSLGMPSYTQFISMLNSNRIKNCPVTAADVTRALHIYGPDIATLKGKTARVKPMHVPPTIIAPIPQDILSHHNSIFVCMDFFFVQGVCFLHSISQGYQFRTVEATPNRSKATILKGFNNVLNTIQPRGITINELRGDQEFQCITDEIRPIKANLASPGEHVPEVERSIRTIKDRTRCSTHDVPFKRFPKILVEACVYNAVRLLNSIPATNGVSKDISPASLITGAGPLDYEKLMKIKYGDYAQVNVESTITNDSKPRTVGAIALYPTGNEQGGWYFMSLQTGKRFNGRVWTILPMPEIVINRVDDIGKTQGQKEVIGKNFTYEWRPDIPFEDDESMAEEDVDKNLIDVFPDTEDDLKQDDAAMAPRVDLGAISEETGELENPDTEPDEKDASFEDELNNEINLSALPEENISNVNNPSNIAEENRDDTTMQNLAETEVEVTNEEEVANEEDREADSRTVSEESEEEKNSIEVSLAKDQASDENKNIHETKKS